MKSSKLIIPAVAAGAAVVAGAYLFSKKRSIPEHATAVHPFDLQKYLGTWYEIARLEYYWECNLDNVTATYSLREDGLVKVDNKGWNFKREEWEESVGKAKPLDDPHTAMLKVSFFGPFYAGYNVIAIDADYKYALVAGDSLDYMWILSREKTIPENIKQEYLNKAKSIGYEVDKLVWTRQDR